MRIQAFSAAGLASLSLLLTACAPPPRPAVDQFTAEFRPGLALPEALALLDRHGVTYSLRSSAECAAQARAGHVRLDLSPQGGPCVFGKQIGTRTWYGAHADLIVQLVFGADQHLFDGHFEAIDELF